MKMESLVLGTCTGKSPNLQLYYEQCEYDMLTSFITCVESRNLDSTVCYMVRMQMFDPFQVHYSKS